MNTTITTMKNLTSFSEHKNRIAFLLLNFFFVLGGFAQIIGWDSAINGTGGGQTFGATPWAPATLNPNLSMVGTGLVRGANITTGGLGATSSWGGNGGWGGTADAGCVYFSFTPNNGFSASLSSLSASMRRSGQGPISGDIEYSINGGGYVVAGSWTAGNGSGQLNTFALTSIAALQNIPAGTVVKFRITFTNLNGGTNWYVTNGTSALNLYGTVSTSGPVVAIVNTGSIVCHGQATGTLTASMSGGGAGPYTYTWLPTGGSASVATGLAAGVYTCIMSSSTSQTASATYTVTQPAPLSATVSATGNVNCYGGTNGSATVTASGGSSASAYTYTWLPGGGSASVGVNLPAGTYTVNVSNSNNCTVATETLSIVQPAVPSVTAVASSTAVCEGATLTLSGAGATTYTWANGITNGVAFTPVTTATYIVTGTNNTTGCVEAASVAVVFYNTPTLTATSASGTLVACAQTTFALSGVGATTYTWSHGIVDGVAFTPTGTAVYTVSGTDANGCTGTKTINIDISPNPTVVPTTARATSCRTETVALSATGANNYTWTVGAASVIATSSAVVVSPTITTTYTVRGRNNSGCVTTATLSQKVSTCVGIESFGAADQRSLLVYPNPNAGVFTIKSSYEVNLLLINSLGQTIQSLQLNEQNQMRTQVSGLSNGIYFIISPDEASGIKQKIIVAK